MKFQVYLPYMTTFRGSGNIRGDASVEHPSIDIIFNIAATPKGVAIKSPTITFRGEEARFAHLIPSL